MKVSEALDYLVQTDEQYGHLRGASSAQEYLIKIAEAEGYLATIEGTQSEKQARARSSEKYKQAVSNYEETKTEMETVAAKRETAKFHIEVWRTQQANRRQGNI